MYQFKPNLPTISAGMIVFTRATAMEINRTLPTNFVITPN